VNDSQNSRKAAHDKSRQYIGNLASGHANIPRKLTIPIGLKVKVDAGKGKLEIPETAVL